MVQAENIDGRCSSFQLDDRSWRDHHSLTRLSKFPLMTDVTGLSGPNSPPPHARDHGGGKAAFGQVVMILPDNPEN